MNAMLLAAACYVGFFGRLDLPEGGSEARRLGGGGARVGCYLDEAQLYAVEGEAAWCEDSASLGADLVVHWQAWSVYGDLFGFSQFDPFFVVGARGWIGSEAGNVGPAAGVGAFWHLDDNWSLRFDAGATLCLDGGAEMRYTLAAGVQYGF